MCSLNNQLSEIRDEAAGGEPEQATSTSSRIVQVKSSKRFQDLLVMAGPVPLQDSA